MFDEVVTRARSKPVVKQQIRYPWCENQIALSKEDVECQGSKGEHRERYRGSGLKLGS
jgi:hypothetical protein